MTIGERIVKRRAFVFGAAASVAAAILAACGDEAAPTPTTAPRPTTGGAAPTTAGTAVPAAPPTALPAAPPTTAPTVAPTAAPAAMATAATTGGATAPPMATTAMATTAPVVMPTAAPAMMTMRTPTGTLKVALPNRVVSLDPTGGAALEGLTYSSQIYGTLITRDPVTNEYKPSLATRWENPDPLTWVFTLRPNVKWHDGSAFTSADVKGTLDRVARLKGPVAPLWATLDSIETPNDLTVRMKFKTPLGTALANASLLYIVPVAQMDKDGFFNKPIGTGPFKVQTYKPDAGLTLEANTAYFDGPPGVQTLQFVDIPETVARMTALDTGEIDLTWGIPPDQLAAVRRNTNLKIDTIAGYGYYFCWINAKRPPFTDKRVRQAMCYAVDVDGMVKNLVGGIGKRATAPIPSTVYGYAAQTPYAYDPNKAKQLLMEAGVAPGTEVQLIWTASGGPQIREISEALISYWNAVGIKVKSGEQERALWLDNLLKLNWDMDLQTNTVATGDADYTLRRLYTTAANRNGYGTPELDKILNGAAETVDQKQRADLYAQANKIIWDDAVGLFPFELVENYAYSSKKVQGFVPAPDSVPRFASVTVK